MNAMEHGNKYEPGVMVSVVVSASEAAVSVRITDQGGGPPPSRPMSPTWTPSSKGSSLRAAGGCF